MDKEELHNIVEEQQPNICQIVCYKDNKKIYSDVWNNYKENDAVHIMSATKSIVSLLIDYLIFVKTFFINLLYYFFVWQTSENDIFFKKLYLFHFFYDKIQLWLFF